MYRLGQLGLLCASLCVSSAYAETTATYAFDVTPAQLQSASSSVTWGRLLLLNDKGESAVQDPRFFLQTADGKIDAQAEMQALLQAWQSDDSRACAFPARLAFVREALAIDMPLPNCPEFDDWFTKMASTRLSVIFADEHPNNLASGFGHTLLRADTEGGAIAINYTPDYPTSANPATGAIKSLTGGYLAIMEILPFAQKQHDYLVRDKRDIWQYTLALNSAQIAQIMRHIYEVQGVARAYYLTHDNCATEIVRLVDVVRSDLALGAKLLAITTPADITRVLDKAGLIANTEYMPSTASLAQAALNNAHQPISAPLTATGNPVTAVGASKLQFIYTHQADDDRFALEYRPAYHDALDTPTGVRQYVDVEVLSAQILLDNRPQLDKLTFLRQRSYNPYNTAKAYSGIAYDVHAGMIPDLDSTGARHRVGHLAVALGKSRTLGQGRAGTTDLANQLCYALGGGAVQFGNVDKGYRVGATATLGCVQHVTDKMRYRAELSVPYWYSASRHSSAGYAIPTVALTGQYDTKWGAVRAGVAWQKVQNKASVQTVNVSYGHYF